MKEVEGGGKKKEKTTRPSTRRIPAACEHGRRLVKVTVATGAILPIWRDISQTVLAEARGKDDPLRVVQAETDATAAAASKRIVGMEVMSYFLPGGGTTHTATPLEKVYVGIEGNLTIVTDDDETTLAHLDSVYLAPNEGRSIINRTNKIASILVIMPYPPKD